MAQAILGVNLGGLAMVMTTIDHDQDGFHVNYYETVLHKEGHLDLTPTDPTLHDHVKPDDSFEVLGLNEDLSTEMPMKVLLKHADGSVEELPCKIC